MKLPTKLLLVASASLLLSISWPSSADSCSRTCFDSWLVPATGEVPTNISAILWAPAGSSRILYDAGDVAFTRIDLGQPVNVPFSLQVSGGFFLIVPEAALVVGADYRLRTADRCGSGAQFIEANYHIVATAPVPTTLGRVRIAPTGLGDLMLATGSGTCDTLVVADQVPITLEFSDPALTWKDALLFETYVDGTRWSPASSLVQSIAPGASWQGRGQDLMYTICDSIEPATEGLTEGTHTVQFRARLLAGTQVFVSDTATFDLACTEPSSGCGCTVVQANQRTTSWLLLLLAATLLILRRRRYV